MGEIDLDKDDAVDKVMNEFDTSRDDNIQEEEFIEGISKWINEADRSVAFSGSYSQRLHHFHMVSSSSFPHAVFADPLVDAIYGGATMNNILCLAVFLALVYVRHLTWDFSAEVLVILVVCIVMGIFTSLRTTFPLWTCFVAFLLYPLSLLLVYLLDFVFGWS
ncbi:hypothetical protein BHE74_00039729 [Ensete ventricosum]|nr:hypothetical protein BHE74_00039729 [Ensete ventricosum]RZS06976.1 hypothetical protein BHM03_00037739 [Ensete ventricosum]